MCCAGHGDDNKTNNTTIPEWYFGSVALWHKNRAGQNGRGSPKGQSTRTALRLVEQWTAHFPSDYVSGGYE